MRPADNIPLNPATIMPLGKLYENYESHASPSGESSWELLTSEDHARSWTKRVYNPYTLTPYNGCFAKPLS